MIYSQPVFTPLNLYGCKAWYDATQQALGVVSTWTDQSGNGNDAISSGASRPTCTANQQNGRNTLLFNGSNALNMPSGLYGIPVAANTVFIIAKRNTNAAVLEVICDLSLGSSTREALFYDTSAGDICYRNDDGTQTEIISTGNTNTNYNIIQASYDGITGVSVSVNGTAAVTGSSGRSGTGVDTARIGDLNGIVPLTGGIAEMLIYNRLLNATEIATLKSYLSNKWKIPLV